MQITPIDIYLSPDDSLATIIGPGGSGSVQAQEAILYDLVRGVAIGGPQFFSASNLVVQLAANQVTISGTGPQAQPISLAWTVP